MVSVSRRWDEEPRLDNSPHRCGSRPALPLNGDDLPCVSSAANSSNPISIAAVPRGAAVLGATLRGVLLRLPGKGGTGPTLEIPHLDALQN